MRYPDTGASSIYTLDEALFQGDPAGILTGSFTANGLGIQATLSAGGVAFTDLWDSAHVVWRAKRRADGSLIPLWSGVGEPKWSQAIMSLEGQTNIANTEAARIQVVMIGAPAGATQLSDISGGTPQILGGGLEFNNASGPQAVTSVNNAGGVASGNRYTAAGVRVSILAGVAPPSPNGLYANRVLAEPVKDLKTEERSGAGSLRAANTSTLNQIDSTDDAVYIMLSVLKTGSATGGAFSYIVRSRFDTRGGF